MAERLRAKRGFFYPADAESVRRIQQAGGLSKMDAEERAAVTMKTIAVGDFCDDMPADAAVRYLERGEIERVTVDARMFATDEDE